MYDFSAASGLLATLANPLQNLSATQKLLQEQTIPRFGMASTDHGGTDRAEAAPRWRRSFGSWSTRLSLLHRCSAPVWSFKRQRGRSRMEEGRAEQRGVESKVRGGALETNGRGTRTAKQGSLSFYNDWWPSNHRTRIGRNRPSRDGTGQNVRLVGQQRSDH